MSATQAVGLWLGAHLLIVGVLVVRRLFGEVLFRGR